MTYERKKISNQASRFCQRSRNSYPVCIKTVYLARSRRPHTSRGPMRDHKERTTFFGDSLSSIAACQWNIPTVLTGICEGQSRTINSAGAVMNNRFLATVVENSASGNRKFCTRRRYKTNQELVTTWSNADSTGERKEYTKRVVKPNPLPCRELASAAKRRVRLSISSFRFSKFKLECNKQTPRSTRARSSISARYAIAQQADPLLAEKGLAFSPTSFDRKEKTNHSDNRYNQGDAFVNKPRTRRTTEDSQISAAQTTRCERGRARQQ